MKSTFLTLLIACMVMLSHLSTGFAMTRATSEPQTKPDYDIATGYYGGIKSGKLVLILSEQGGLRYYDLPAGRLQQQDGVDLQKLQNKTPILVKSKAGKVIDITIQEVHP